MHFCLQLADRNIWYVWRNSHPRLVLPNRIKNSLERTIFTITYNVLFLNGIYDVISKSDSLNSIKSTLLCTRDLLSRVQINLES